MRRALDRGHRATEPHPVAERRRHLLDITLAAALHRAPDRTVILQQAMVAEERDEILGGKVQHLAGRRRPDRGAHRRQIIGQQPRCEMARLEIVAERQTCEPARRIVLDALLVEGQDIPQHPQIGRRQQIAALREQALGGLAPVDAAAFPFEAAGIRGHGKTHAAFHGLDAEMGEQSGEVGVIQLVIDDEADIDRNRLSQIIDGDGMAMAAGAEFAIIDGDGISPGERPGGGIAGNPRSDNRYPHCSPRLLISEIRRNNHEVSARPLLGLDDALRVPDCLASGGGR